jgi:hypothetical protein
MSRLVVMGSASSKHKGMQGGTSVFGCVQVVEMCVLSGKMRDAT